MSRRSIAFACLIVVAAIFLGAMTIPQTPYARPNPAGAVVKVTTPVGYGSGVHIGDGYIFTAAHVVNDLAKIQIKDTKGEVHEGRVLWVNHEYDVALLRIDPKAALAPSPLFCGGDVAKGRTVFSEGNPRGLENITIEGRIVGASQVVGRWRSVLVAEMFGMPGISGGGAFDEAGRVVGLTVGGMGDKGNLRGFYTFIVPNSALCLLMGRA